VNVRRFSTFLSISGIAEADLSSGTWDRIRLRQLANLLGTTQHGGSSFLIQFAASDEGADVKVSVHINGPPIPHGMLLTIFDPLMRSRFAAPGETSVCV
jgi:hypothetical protein